MSLTVQPAVRALRCLLLCLAAVLAAGQACGQAAVQPRPAAYALVAGINRYGELHSLQGAVHDAQDVAAALESRGVKVTLLLDGQVTTSALHAAWLRLQREAPAGSLLIFHYAGHSAEAQEPKQNGSDGRYDFLVFGGFHERNRASPGREPEQALTGHQLRRWMQATPFRVLTIYDSCTSGRLYRAPQLTTLLGSRAAFGDLDVLGPSPAGPVAAGEDADPGVTANQIFIAAAPLGRNIREMVIGGQERGALSYYFAKALRGATNSSGTTRPLTTRELFTYVRDSVRRQTADNQDPVLLTGRDYDEPLLDVPGGNPIPPSATLPTIRMQLIGGTPSAGLTRLTGLTLVGPQELADLRLDLARRRVLNEYGQVVVSDTDAGNATELQGIIDKWRYVAALRDIASAHPQEVRLHVDGHPDAPDGRAPGEWLYAGQRISLSVPDLGQRLVLVVNLSSAGELQLMYPRAKGTRQLAADGSLYLPATVRTPYGADSIVVISAQDPRLKDVIHSVQSAEGYQSLQRLDSEGSLLLQISKLHEVRAGLVPLFTCASATECPNQS